MTVVEGWINVYCWLRRKIRLGELIVILVVTWILMELPRHLHELITHYSLHNVQPLDSVINQFNAFHLLTFSFLSSTLIIFSHLRMFRECFLLFIFSYEFLYALIFPVLSPTPIHLVTLDFSTLLIFSKGDGFWTFLTHSRQHYTHDISWISELNMAAVSDAVSQTKLACNGTL